MNRVMWSNHVTQDNAELLESRGIVLFGPDVGHQACGEIGKGRMLEPKDLVEAISSVFEQGFFQGVNVLITAGPTREAIDPVRYITNRSSGRMGFALAQAAVDAGAHVTLITGPVSLTTPRGVKRVDVETALDMRDAVMREISGAQVFIACAAVADYRPVKSAAQKMKKTHDQISLELTQNPDIVAEVATLESPPFIMGFAAETQALEKNAKIKLQSKRLDMIAANLVDQPDSGFESEYNALKVFWPGGHRSLIKAPKSKLARELIELLAQRYGTSQQ
jgi:phosphopantothenoylcysteine decarboxylase/phosphopantothenate--cysteine ligase